jgi:hypothetical protein
MGTTNHTSKIKENNLLYQGSIIHRKLAKGTLTGKKPLYIDQNTTVYVNSDKTQAECKVIRAKYLMNMEKLNG